MAVAPLLAAVNCRTYSLRGLPAHPADPEHMGDKVIGDRHAQQHGLGTIDLGLKLSRGRAESGIQTGQFRPLSGLIEKLLSQI